MDYKDAANRAYPSCYPFHSFRISSLTFLGIFLHLKEDMPFSQPYNRTPHMYDLPGMAHDTFERYMYTL